MNIVISKRIREIGRLKLSIMKASVITSSIYTLKPNHYELIVAASKVVCDYDPNKSSSLALHFGTNFKFLCNVAQKAILTNKRSNSLILNHIIQICFLSTKMKLYINSLNIRRSNEFSR